MLQHYILDKDYAFNLDNRRLPAEHGLIIFMIKMAYTYNHGYNSAEWGGFDGAWKELKKAGWNVNYLKADLEKIFNDVTENARFIDDTDFDVSKHIEARL